MPTAITLHILTCPGREPELAKTLASLTASDWPGAPMITRDSGEAEAPEGNPIARGHLAALRAALQGPGDYFLVLEDDVDVDARLAARLIAWPPLMHGWVNLAHLYDSGIRRLRPTGEDPALPPAKHPDGPSWFDADVETAIGAQARLLSRPCAEHILRAWPPRGAGQHQDLLMAKLAAQIGPVFVHRPSLVEHRCAPSTWGGPAHRSVSLL